MPPKGKKIPKLSEVVGSPIGDEELKKVVDDAKALGLPVLPPGGLLPLPPLDLPPMPGSAGKDFFADPDGAFKKMENKVAEMLTRQHLKSEEDAKDRHKIITAYFDQIMKDVREIREATGHFKPPFDAFDQEEEYEQEEKSEAPSADVLAVIDASKRVMELYAKSGEPLQPHQYKSLVATGIAQAVKAGTIKSAELEECYMAFTASLG